MKKINLFIAILLSTALITGNFSSNIQAAAKPPKAGFFTRTKARFTNWRAKRAEVQGIKSRKRAENAQIKAQRAARKAAFVGTTDTKKAAFWQKKVAKSVTQQAKYQRTAEQQETRATKLGRKLPKIQKEKVRSAEELIGQYRRTSIAPEFTKKATEPKSWWQRLKKTVTKPARTFKKWREEKKELKAHVSGELVRRKEVKIQQATETARKSVYAPKFTAEKAREIAGKNAKKLTTIGKEIATSSPDKFKGLYEQQKKLHDKNIELRIEEARALTLKSLKSKDPEKITAALKDATVLARGAASVLKNDDLISVNKTHVTKLQKKLNDEADPDKKTILKKQIKEAKKEIKTISGKDIQRSQTIIAEKEEAIKKLGKSKDNEKRKAEIRKSITYSRASIDKRQDTLNKLGIKIEEKKAKEKQKPEIRQETKVMTLEEFSEKKPAQKQSTIQDFKARQAPVIPRKINSTPPPRVPLKPYRPTQEAVPAG